MFYCRVAHHTKVILNLCGTTSVKGMSALIRLLTILGWDLPAEKVSDWGERPKVKPSERRSSPRYAASPNEAYVGWWIGEDFRTVSAQFRDLSSKGALIVTREMPPNKHVWVGLATPVRSRWCPMKVMRVKETWVGLVEVALAFQATCDADYFKVLVQRGLSNVDTSVRLP